MRQFQCVPKTYVTEIKETFFKIYTKQVSCPLASYFKHLNLPISIKIPVTIWQIVYIYMTAQGSPTPFWERGRGPWNWEKLAAF